jgi:hypothetical protein
MKKHLSLFFSEYSAELGALGGVVAFYLLLFALGITCPIKFVFGISCPGCGMSRAVFSVLRGDPLKAFYYHPLWVTLIPFAFAFFIFYVKRMHRALNISIGIFGVLMLIVYIYRLFFLTQDIVVCDPQNGAVFKLFTAIADFFSN